MHRFLMGRGLRALYCFLHLTNRLLCLFPSSLAYQGRFQRFSSRTISDLAKIQSLVDNGIDLLNCPSDSSWLVPPLTMSLLAKLVHLDDEDTSLNGVDHDVS
jgi:hypothetical protein